MKIEYARALRIPAGVPVGVLATMTMDAAMVAAAYYGTSSFASDRLGPNVIGRWAAGMLRGRWVHRDIMSEPTQRGELALGIATHYVTGVALAQTYLQLPRPANRRMSFIWATAYGIATALLPMLILYPSLGFGWFGKRSGEAGRIGRIMLLGHAAFGVGIGLWAPLFTRRRATGEE